MFFRMNLAKHISLFLVLTAFLTSQAQAQGECNRVPNWDWTQDVTYNMYTTSQGTISNVRLPYFDYGQPAAELNKGALTDIYPEDGWVLVFRDFGLPACPTAVPLFVLYNKFSGTLRLFYINTVTNNTYTHGLAYMSQPNASKASPFFNHGRSNYFVNSFDKTAVESTIHALGPMQWAYADFTITGYDNTLATDATLKFEIRGINVNNIDLEGDINLEQVVSGEGNVGSKLNFGAVTSAVQNGFKWYKDVDKGKSELTKLKNKNPSAWYSGALGTILNSGIASVASPLAGVAGLVSSFISGSHGGQTMPMKFEGEINLTGTMTNSGLIYSFELRAPGAPLSNPNDSKRPDYTQPLGIYNITGKPTFQYKLGTYCTSNLTGGPVQDGDTSGFFSDQDMWENNFAEMLALNETEFTDAEKEEIVSFIIEDRKPSIQAGEGLQGRGMSNFIGGGGGGGGQTCSDVFYYKLTSLNVIFNPVLSGRTSYTLGVVKGSATTTYASKSAWMMSGGRVVTIDGGVKNQMAIRVKVNTDVSSDPPVSIVNTYDINRYYQYNL